VAVADRVGEGVRAEDTSRRHVAEGSPVVDHAALRAGGVDRRDGQRVAIRVDVVVQYGQGLGRSGVVYGVAVVHRRHRGVDQHGDGRCQGAAVTIADGVGEGVRAVEAGCWLVTDVATVVDHAALRAGRVHRRDGQRVAVGVGVVAQYGQG